MLLLIPEQIQMQIFQKHSKSMSNSNAFYSAISEMGGSMYPMITTMEIVPEREEFRYGSSYLYSATSIIPNLGFGIYIQP